MVGHHVGAVNQTRVLWEQTVLSTAESSLLLLMDICIYIKKPAIWGHSIAVI